MTAAPVAIRTATPAERAALEALQLRASLQSGTYAEQLLGAPEVVAIDSAQFEAGLVRVAERAGRVRGFAVLLAPDGGACELDGIFVEPDAMGTGVGRALIEDAVARARRWGATRIDVVANPDAWAFYERVGFAGDEVVGTLFGPARRMSLALPA